MSATATDTPKVTTLDQWETVHTCVQQAAAICSLIANDAQSGTGPTLPNAAWAAADLLNRAEEALQGLMPEAPGNGGAE